ncbi:hypothetical protein DY000_02060925 [Brassica cretica]|uniref:BRX domain-containing protein n=1 Tax=Brassica cretica TaxID=69181 RepID=A0ABQ7AWI4_BRACR|nr:hypothetical protein DY000_02060925 [Brassica cretica]
MRIIIVTTSSSDKFLSLIKGQEAGNTFSFSSIFQIGTKEKRSLKVEEEAYKAFVSSGGVCEQRWWFGIDDCIRKDVLLMKINGVDPVTFEPIQRESDASVPTPQSSQELDQNSPVH